MLLRRSLSLFRTTHHAQTRSMAMAAEEGGNRSIHREIGA
jgi:hypothetical protein